MGSPVLNSHEKFLFTAMMATLMLPSAVIIPPAICCSPQSGWLDTYLPFIVRPCSQAPFFISSLFSFSAASRASWTKPSLSTAAAPFRTLVRILTLLCKPALVSVGLFNFI